MSDGDERDPADDPAAVAQRHANAAIAVTRKALEEGKAVLDKARQDYGLTSTSGDGEGPLTRAWQQGKFPPRNPQVTLTESSEHQPSLVEMCERIKGFEQAGRWIAAAMGLAVLRRRYEALDSEDLPEDQRTWDAFIAKHLQPLVPAEKVNELLGRMLHRNSLLRCVKCGAQSRCECGCCAPYLGENRFAMAVPPAPALPAPVPETALDRALAAIKAHPTESTRRIAEQIGVGAETVRRARRQVRNAEAPMGQLGAVEKKRLGRDGRWYRLPVRAKDLAQLPPVPPPTPEQLEQDIDLLEEMHPDAANAPETRWQWSTEIFLGNWIAAEAHWDRNIPGWREITPSSTTLTLLRQAHEASKRLFAKYGIT